MKTMIIKDIPDTLKKQFKVACAEGERSMNEVIIDLMQCYVEEKEDIIKERETGK